MQVVHYPTIIVFAVLYFVINISISMLTQWLYSIGVIDKNYQNSENSEQTDVSKKKQQHTKESEIRRKLGQSHLFI